VRHQQRRADAHHAHICAADIGNLPAEHLRVLHTTQQAIERDVIQVMPADRLVGAVLPPAGERTVDDARIGGLEAFVIHAQAASHAGAEALHDHIRRFHQFMEDALPIRLLQVEDDALLIAVAGAEECPQPINEGRHPAGVISRDGVFYLDDFRAHIRQQQGRNRPWQQAR